MAASGMPWFYLDGGRGGGGEIKGGRVRGGVRGGWGVGGLDACERKGNDYKGCFVK